jgi:hypothetical protein
MITITENRSNYLSNLKGSGRLYLNEGVCHIRRAGASDPGARRVADVPGFVVTSAPAVAVNGRSKFAGRAGQSKDTAMGEDFLILSNYLSLCPNPIAELVDLSMNLRDFGTLALFEFIPQLSPFKDRPVVTIDHVLSDYTADVSVASDEHILSNVLAFNPQLFDNIDEISVLLHVMWKRKIEYMDQECWSLVKNSRNKTVLEGLLKNRKDSYIHHAFDVKTILEIFRFLTERKLVAMVPYDVGLSKGSVSEMIILFKKVPFNLLDDGSAREFLECMMRTFNRVLRSEYQIEGVVEYYKRRMGD